jgi:hypothetical protein
MVTGRYMDDIFLLLVLASQDGNIQFCNLSKLCITNIISMIFFQSFDILEVVKGLAPFPQKKKKESRSG